MGSRQDTVENDEYWWNPANWDIQDADHSWSAHILRDALDISEGPGRPLEQPADCVAPEHGAETSHDERHGSMDNTLPDDPAGDAGTSDPGQAQLEVTQFDDCLDPAFLIPPLPFELLDVDLTSGHGAVAALPFNAPTPPQTGTMLASSDMNISEQDVTFVHAPNLTFISHSPPPWRDSHHMRDVSSTRDNIMTPAQAPHGVENAARPKRRRGKLSGKSSRTDALTADGDPKTIMKRDHVGKVHGFFNTFGLNTPVRAEYTEQARASTALARKHGVCDRCKKFKARCELPDNPYEPCKRCSTVASGVTRSICVRVSLLDLSLHRLGSTKDDALDKWMSLKLAYGDAADASLVTDYHTLRVTQDFGYELEICVSKFHVLPNDTTSYPWRDSSGRLRHHEMPPYYVHDMRKHEAAVVEYVNASYLGYIQRLLRSQNPLMIKTFQEAIRYSAATPNSLVKDVLRFWGACRLTELPWRICGENTLGMSPVPDLDSPRSGTVPITPIMDTQLDHMVTQSVVSPLRRKILAQLHTKIMGKHKTDWYDIYLAMFVLMSNVERQLATIPFFCDFYGMQTRFGSKGNSSLSNSYIHSAKTLLAYFRYVSGGQTPLMLDWRQGSAPRGIMGREQKLYMEETRADIERQGDSLARLKEGSMYKMEMYWCHQLLTDASGVDEQNEADVDELHEDDFIVHCTNT